jgi:hypothetical protein
MIFTRFFLALALLGCLAAATEPSFNNLRKKNGKKRTSDAAELHADIKIKGLKKDPSANEIAMIDDAIKLALNDGHKDSDYVMTDVVNEKIWIEPDVYVLFDSQAGDDSSLTGPYYVGGYGKHRNFLVHAMLRYSCYLCREGREDDDASAALRQFELTGPPKVSSADEKEVCKMLRKSGVDNFADVHDCSVKLLPNQAASAYDFAIAAE